MTKVVTDQTRHRRYIANEIETHLFMECCVDRTRCVHHEQCVAIRRGTHDSLGGDIGACARPVLDNEWLIEPF